MYACIFQLVLWEHSQAFPWNNLPSNWEVRFPKVNTFISSLFSDHFLKALKGLVGLHRTVQLQLLQHYWLGHRLELLRYLNGLPWRWTEIILSFWRLYPGTAFWTLVDHDGYSISSKGFLPAVVDIMVIWVKFTHLVHFSLLIPRMSTFTLAISCMTTSNLPWFMDLTFQVPMQYCSLQHRTLLLSPVTSTVLFLLWLHSFILSGVIFSLISSSILGTYRLREFPFQYPIILPFHTVHGVLKTRILKWFAIPFSSGPHSMSQQFYSFVYIWRKWKH